MYDKLYIMSLNFEDVNIFCIVTEKKLFIIFLKRNKK
jgi:hypothetical protein